MLDSAARMAFLLFLPFLLQAKGRIADDRGPGPVAGLYRRSARQGGLRLARGAPWPARDRDLDGGAVRRRQSWACSPCRWHRAWILLPFLGVMLNGTSSVLYGTVPELVTTRRIERAFALFYTGTLGSSALAPVLVRAGRRRGGAGVGGRCGSADSPRGRAAHAAAVTAAGIERECRALLMPVSCGAPAPWFAGSPSTRTAIPCNSPRNRQSQAR